MSNGNGRIHSETETEELELIAALFANPTFDPHGVQRFMMGLIPSFSRAFRTL
jgi:hypothetical protein